MDVCGGWVMVSSPAGADAGMMSFEVEVEVEVELAALLDVAAAVVDIFEDDLVQLESERESRRTLSVVSREGSAACGKTNPARDCRTKQACKRGQETEVYRSPRL